MLALVLVHGVFWSGLLSRVGAYVTSTSSRRIARAEGIGYWGLVDACSASSVAPSIGLWVFEHGGWRRCASRPRR